MNLLPQLITRYWTKDGRPLAFGTLESQISGSDTRTDTYKDSDGSAKNTNPIKLSASGEADVYIDPNITYKFILRDSDGNVVKEIPVVTTEASGSVTGGTVKVTATDTNADYLANKLTEGDNVTLTVNNDILGDTLEVMALDEKLKVSSTDTTTGYLDEKVTSPDSSIVIGTDAEKLTIKVAPSVIGESSLAEVSTESTDASSSTYKMTGSTPVKFERSNNTNGFLTLDEDASRVTIGADLTADSYTGDGANLSNVVHEVLTENGISNSGTASNPVLGYDYNGDLLGLISGTTREVPTLTLVKDTGVWYVDVEAEGTGDIEIFMSGAEYVLDCTTGTGVSGKARSEALTLGTISVPSIQWVWMEISVGVPVIKAI
jgi:hypothetical protein